MRILLIISGGIAAYKSLEFIRLCQKNTIDVVTILTKAGREFVTPMSLAALSQNPVHQDFSVDHEAQANVDHEAQANVDHEAQANEGKDLDIGKGSMGHIQLSRDADYIVIAPATADIIARMAMGMANDLATTVLLASDKPIFIAPAMNVRMWHHPATQSNLALLKARGISIIGPDEGEMACGEYGLGRMIDPENMLSELLKKTPQINPQKYHDLKGLRFIVTAGPTQEAIDPVRMLTNRSSGKQGYAIAEALKARGGEVILISGPTSIPDPTSVTDSIGSKSNAQESNGIIICHQVNSADEMLNACQKQLPADCIICCAAVSDFKAKQQSSSKIKKNKAEDMVLEFEQTPDILHTLSKQAKLVIGFAAETDDLERNAEAKLKRKGCHWLLANSVKDGQVFGQDHNQILFLNSEGETEQWPQMSKTDIAQKLALKISQTLNQKSSKSHSD